MTQTLALQNTAHAAMNGINCLVYGPSGIGKTTLCATAPNPVLFGAEGGMLSLNWATLPYYEIRTVKDLQDVFNWAQGSTEAKQFESFCLDSLTEIAEVVLLNAKAQVKDPRQAYGELIEQMMHTVRAFRDLQGKNVIMTAHQAMVKDESTQITMHTASMPGTKLGPKLPYHFDEVFRYVITRHPETGAQERMLQTEADFNTVAKDRSCKLDKFEQPNLSNIFAKIKGT